MLRGAFRSSGEPFVSSGEPFVVKSDYKFKADPAFNQDGRLDKVSKKTPMEGGGVEVEKIEKITGSKGLSVSITGGEVNDKKNHFFSFLVTRIVMF